MRLTVTRFIFTDFSTIGILDSDGKFLCYTLEPVTRDDNVKPRAIPCAVYGLVISHSPELGYSTPEVLGVPGFTGIRLHILNSFEQTQGCTGVGKTRASDWIGQSEEAFKELMAVLAGQENLSIEYREERAISA